MTPTKPSSPIWTGLVLAALMATATGGLPAGTGKADASQAPLVLAQATPAAATSAAQPETPAPSCPAPPLQEASKPNPHPSNAVAYRPFPATWQRALDSFTADGSVPGAVIIVKSPDWGVRVGTTGLANIATHTPVDPGMQFRVGSVTKAFLAQAILRLEQEGKLRLTDPVLKFLGDNKLIAGIPGINLITVGELLQHTAGLGDYQGVDEIRLSPQLTPHRHFDPDQLIAGLSAAAPGGVVAPPQFSPGDRYYNPYWLTVHNLPAWLHFPQEPLPLPKVTPTDPEPPKYPMWYYQNTNYLVLGMIAEKVTGLKAPEILRHYVFDVVGLKDTYFATDDQHLPAMHGYTKTAAFPYPTQSFTDWCDVTSINPSYAWTAGAIVSTPWDLLQFEDSMFASNRLLDEGTKNKWLTFVSADLHLGWEPMMYGMGGLMQPGRAYGLGRGHGGAFPGYKALIYYFFDQKVSFVVSSNTWDGSWEVAMLDKIMPQVSSAVTTPRPANAAHAVRLAADGTVELAWQAGRVYGSTYTVYWGTDADQIERAGESAHEGVSSQTVTGVTVKVKVRPRRTYYWRVDTVAPGQPLPLVTGPSWQFRTM
jgi:D-alanyl-D-alanine carboxypeptidase